MVNVTCAIIWFDEKILVTQRSPSMNLPHKWEFPGGKLEPHESDVECIKREIKEEINIEIEVIGRLSDSTYDYGNIQINLIPFIANFKHGEIILAEHSDYKLVYLHELVELDFAEADIPIINELLNAST